MAQKKQKQQQTEDKEHEELSESQLASYLRQMSQIERQLKGALVSVQRLTEYLRTLRQSQINHSG